jgi:hypothetical protein
MTALSSILSDIGRLFQAIGIAAAAFLFMLGTTRGDEAIITLVLLIMAASFALGYLLRSVAKLMGKERTRI